MYFCQMANDIWKNMLNFHQRICQVKDDQFDLTYELEVLEKLIDRHLVEVNTCATSLNVLNEGTSEDEYVCFDEPACVSWNVMDVDEDNDPVVYCQLIDTTSKVLVKVITRVKLVVVLLAIHGITRMKMKSIIRFVILY